MRTTHTTDHLATLDADDARRAAWAPLDPDVDYAWTEEVAGALESAAAALLQAARAIAGTDARARALQAVAARFGSVEAALMLPAAAAACARAAERIEGCSGIECGDRLVRKAAGALLEAATVH